MNKIIETWNYINRKYSSSEIYWRLTATNVSMFKILSGYLADKRYSTALDAGAGNLAFKKIISLAADKYYSFDFTNNNCGIDFIGDVRQMPCKDSAVDLVVCSAVLEHLPQPQECVNEVFRAVRNNGTIVLTAPHFHYIHGEPADYWRFTEFGLAQLIDTADIKYQKIIITEVGYLINFFVSIIAPVLIAAALSIKIIPEKLLLRIAGFINLVFYKFDRLFKSKKLCLGYIIFIEKVKK